ncbi:unnamed protein product [Paramecium octaurelia]|uniref:Uncharacterized protein n=1 Tax=Paramecium octaurelia TaxID=43137 RepID=A0A8S1U0Q7_PAROT|nr:unnamed protein product [Paramecium octaurelia]CAD8157516.1 unnamed protein product [Paramecium octaurelia]
MEKRNMIRCYSSIYIFDQPINEITVDHRMHISIAQRVKVLEQQYYKFTSKYCLNQTISIRKELQVLFQSTTYASKKCFTLSRDNLSCIIVINLDKLTNQLQLQNYQCKLLAIIFTLSTQYEGQNKYVLG